MWAVGEGGKETATIFWGKTKLLQKRFGKKQLLTRRKKKSLFSKLLLAEWAFVFVFLVFKVLRFFVVCVSWVCNVCKYGMDRRYICQFPLAWFRLQVKRTHSNERASQLRPNQVLFRCIHLCTACRDSDLHYGKLHTAFSLSLILSLLMITEPFFSFNFPLRLELMFTEPRLSSLVLFVAHVHRAFFLFSNVQQLLSSDVLKRRDGTRRHYGQVFSVIEGTFSKRNNTK